MDARGIVGASVGELTPGWAHEQVALAIEGEGVAGQLAFGLVLALEHRHMRLDAPLDQPGQKRAGAVAAAAAKRCGISPSRSRVRCSMRLAAAISWLRRAGVASTSRI